MVKKIHSQLNLQRQKIRSTIQVLSKKFPNKTDRNISKMLGVSPMTVNRWKKKDNFIDKKRKRKSKLTKKLISFLLKKAANKFTGINNTNYRKLAKQIKYKFF